MARRSGPEKAERTTHHDPAVLEAELLERGLVVDRHLLLA
jgi:hypothetical protein